MACLYARIIYYSLSLTHPFMDGSMMQLGLFLEGGDAAATAARAVTARAIYGFRVDEAGDTYAAVEVTKNLGDAGEKLPTFSIGATTRLAPADGSSSSNGALAKVKVDNTGKVRQ